MNNEDTVELSVEERAREREELRAKLGSMDPTYVYEFELVMNRVTLGTTFKEDFSYKYAQRFPSRDALARWAMDEVKRANDAERIGSRYGWELNSLRIYSVDGLRTNLGREYMGGRRRADDTLPDGVVERAWSHELYTLGLDRNEAPKAEKLFFAESRLGPVEVAELMERQRTLRARNKNAGPVASNVSIQERFEKFNQEHADVLKTLVRLACEAKARGFQTYGIKALFEVARWNLSTSGPDSSGFKIPNDFSSRYARRIMELEPELEGFFTTRELTSL